jgi:hypothetical protein
MRRFQQFWPMLLILGVTCFSVQPASGADKKTDPTGTWKWERTRGENTRQYTLRIQLDGDKVTGTYASRRNDSNNESKIENAKLEGDKLSFRVVREFNDRKFTINMQGKVAENTITGNGEFSVNGEAREFPWVAKRSVDIQDVLGTWRFTVETENGTLEPTIKFTEKDGKLKGMYTGRSTDREATKISIKDNQLSFTISGENDGNAWNVVYKGKPRGNAIKGSVDYDFGGSTGTIDFVGKRDPVKKKPKDKESGDLKKQQEDKS